MGAENSDISENEDLQEQVKQQQQQIDQLLAMMKAQQQQTLLTTGSGPTAGVVMEDGDCDDSDSAQPPQMKRQKIEGPADDADLKAMAYAPPPTPSPVSTPAPTQQPLAAIATTAVNPLKAMLFIDGTWLYYSIYEREANQCPIMLKFGRGWQRRYYFDWAALPRVICSALQHQHTRTGWASQARPVDIVRASVFTSYKADTHPKSFRFQMYQEMSNANYDVHMMETVGRGEKCVDINIAVEMLHYATVPNAYDVAVLLTGDKDFMPAMIRTRQKGRRVALVSMRRGCNRALHETPTDDNNNTDHGNKNIRDYDVVWIEDYLDDLIKPRTLSGKPHGELTEFTTAKIVSDFISQSGISRVNSRDLGRYLKSLIIGNIAVLDDIKSCYGNLHQFVSTSGCFFVEAKNNEELAMTSDKSFWVGLTSDADLFLTKVAKSARLSAAEKMFFDHYSLDSIIEDPDLAFFASYQLLGRIDSSAPPPRFRNGHQVFQKDETPVVVELPEELTRDYSELTVSMLKEYCRESGLKVSGTKGQLLERIQEYVNKQIEKLQEQNKVASEDAQSSERPEGIGYLEELVMEYCHAKGGRANSRDLGRYLAANKASPNRLAMSGGNVRVTALQELKEKHGSTNGFVLDRPTLFGRQDMPPSDYPDDDHRWKYTFYINLLQPPPSPKQEETGEIKSTL